MFRWRLISAVILITTNLLLAWLDYLCGTPQWFGKPGLVLLPCALVVGLMAANEVLYFSQDNSTRIKHWAVYVGTTLVILSSFTPLLWDNYSQDCNVGRMGWPLFGIAAGVGIAFVSQMIGYRPGDRVATDLALTIMVIAYVGLLISFWAPIRMFYDNQWGIVALLSLFVTVKMSDSMAYTIGKSFGRRKMAPNLSPGKTVEGLIGGVGGGVLGALIVFYGFAPLITGSPTRASWILVVVFGVVVTLAGVVGDLAESLLKRDGGVKNSSKWLRGLGGIMDIVDSIIVAGPVVLAFWSSGAFTPIE